MGINTDKVKNAGNELAKGGVAVVEVFKSVLVGGKGKAAGALGGIAGFIKGIGNTAVSLGTGTAAIVGKSMQNIPRVTAVAVTIGAVIGVNKWMNNRKKSKELESVQNTNELMETRLANDAIAGQLKAGDVPPFDNQETRADFVKKYGERPPQQQPAAAR